MAPHPSAPSPNPLPLADRSAAVPEDLPEEVLARVRGGGTAPAEDGQLLQLLLQESMHRRQQAYQNAANVLRRMDNAIQQKSFR